MCNHNGTSHGALRRTAEPGVLLMVIVCDKCNEVVAYKGVLAYIPNPLLPNG